MSVERVARATGAFLADLARGPGGARFRAVVARPRVRLGLLVALPVALLAASAVGGDGGVAREVSALVARGDLAAAHARIDEAARRGGSSPFLEKLRGDVACARGAGGECLRRYRVALAAEPELREDEPLRENVRALLVRADGCGERRAAAELLGELRDPKALPALRQARRNSGILGFLCTGNSLDRAIEATRAAER